MASAAPNADLMVGSEVAGRYRVTEFLGERETGRVYRAVEVGPLARPVAVRVWDDAPPASVMRFEAASQAILELRHPSMAKLVDSGTLPDGRFFVVRELVGGDTLESVLEGGATAPLRLLRATRQVADALIEAHGEGLVHGDLCPANIFLERVGGRELARVVDFAIGPITRLPGGDEPVVGRPGYLAPEAIVGGHVDHRADLYALGVILFEGLAGRPPFPKERETPEDPTPRLRLLARHAREPAPALSAVGCAVEASLEELVARLLSKSPDERPTTALAVRDLVDAELQRFELDDVPELSERGLAVRPTLPADAIEPGPLEIPAVFGQEDSGSGTEDLPPAKPERAAPLAKDEISRPTIEISLPDVPAAPPARNRAATDEISRPTIEIALEGLHVDPPQRTRGSSVVAPRAPSIPRPRSVSSVRGGGSVDPANARPPIADAPGLTTNSSETLVNLTSPTFEAPATLLDADPASTLREDSPPVVFDSAGQPNFSGAPATLLDNSSRPPSFTEPTFEALRSDERSSPDVGFGPSPSQDSIPERADFGPSPSDGSISGREIGFGPGRTDGGESNPAGSYEALQARADSEEEEVAKFDGEEITSPGDDEAESPSEQTVVTEDPNPQPIIPLLPRGNSLARTPLARDPASRVGPALQPAPIPPEGGPIELRPMEPELMRSRQLHAPLIAQPLPAVLPSVEPGPPQITVTSSSSTRAALLLAVVALLFVLVIVVFAVSRFGATPIEATVVPPPPTAIGAVAGDSPPGPSTTPPEPPKLELLKVRLESNPRYALVVVNGAEIGRTPVLIPAPSADSSLRVEIKLEDHKPYSADLVIDGATGILRADNQAYSLLPNSTRSDPDSHEFKLTFELEKVSKAPAKKKGPEKKRKKKQARPKKPAKSPG
ncbi:MAG: protein kinase [Deltaproteobacteria bacterium]|nr:protein kinase [Deltaproteobacteria bacterium]